MDDKELIEQEEELYESDPYDSIDWKEEQAYKKWRRRWRDEHPFNQHDFL